MGGCIRDQEDIDDKLTYRNAFVWIGASSIYTLGKTGAYAHTCAPTVCDRLSVCTWVCVCGQVNGGELFFQCHIFGMAVLCPRLLHSW